MVWAILTDGQKSVTVQRWTDRRLPGEERAGPALSWPEPRAESSCFAAKGLTTAGEWWKEIQHKKHGEKVCWYHCSVVVWPYRWILPVWLCRDHLLHVGYKSASSAAFHRENDSTPRCARVTCYHHHAPSDPHGTLSVSVFLCHGVCFPCVPLHICTLFKNAIFGAKAHELWSLQEHFWQSGMQKPPSLVHPSVGMLSAVGEDNCGAWRHAGERGPGTVIPWPCIQGLCIWVLCFIQWKWRLCNFVSREPTVLAPLLSWGLLPRLESLKVMGMAVKEGNRAGWKEFLLGNGGLALAGNSCSQIKKKNNALPGANTEQKSYLGRESWRVPASLLCTSIVFSSQKGKKTY